MRPFNPLMLHLLALVSVVLWSIDLTALNVTLLMTDLHCCCVSEIALSSVKLLSVHPGSL